jgi:hypothetical protein
LLTTTTTALAFHVDSAGNPTIRQSDVDTARGTTAAAGGSGGNTNTTVATVALNYINETRKAIQVGNSTGALTNLDLVERQLSLLIGDIISPPENQTAATASSNTSSSSSPLLSSPSTPSIQTPSAVIVEEPTHENCNDNADNDNDGQIDEGCGNTARR